MALRINLISSSAGNRNDSRQDNQFSLNYAGMSIKKKVNKFDKMVNNLMLITTLFPAVPGSVS
jgi:hypothetical protein